MNPLEGNPLATRDDVAAALMALWRPLRPYYSTGGARVSLSSFGAHFPIEAAELEGFARPLWGIAPLLAGGFDFPDTALLLSGLANGTDPQHPEYWGPIGDRDQHTVEAAAIAFALMVAPDHLWAPLPQASKHRLAVWLDGALRVEVPANNWNFFVVLCGTALRRLGYPVPEASLDRAFDALETYWMGNGWYRDGSTRQLDHYIAFAMHFYGLLYARLNGDADPGRASMYRERARTFAPHYRHWFADDGAVLPFGRSLTYRFAPAGFWGALGFSGDASGTGAKGLFLKHLRWWRDNADFDRDGVLPVGYAYPNPQMAEPYNSAQSPYWAFKAFAPLALPADDPFWTAPEDVPPAEPFVTQPEPGFVLQRDAAQVVALTAGQQAPQWFRHAPEKYGKFAYSTRYGFSVESERRDFPGAAFDSMLVFSRDGITFDGRHDCLDARIGEGFVFSRWSPFADVEVETWLLPVGLGHVRVHRIVTAIRVLAGEGGFAVPRLTIDGRGEESGIAYVETASDYSGIRSLGGPPRGGLVQVARPNTNLMAPRTLVPQLRGELLAGEHVLATLVVASPDRQAARRALADPPGWSLAPLLAAIEGLPPAPGWDIGRG